jgi:enoyl reductase-like protein/acyl dehydratase
MRFLPVGVPYHSAYLQGATAKVTGEDYKGAELWSASDLAIAVHNTFDGSDMRSYEGASIVKSVSDQIFTEPIYWIQATNVSKDITHIIDFGTGGLSGIGGLTARNLEGRGTRVVIPSGVHASSSELYSRQSVKFEPRWEEAFMPRLVKNADGKILIDTPYSRLTSRKPLLIAGMTPSTVQPGLIIAAAKAGANAEIAGGGHYSPKSMLAKVQAIQKEVPPGSGLSWNGLFINPRHFPWQLAEWCALRKQGYPLDAWTTAAGIPSTDKAKEIVGQLKEAGIEHMTLKPGSVEGIRQTCAIAASNPDFFFVINWTGGRAGGHHSYEDVFQPIIQTYSLIRKYSNISLLAGSGLGDSESIWPWMSGEWSLQFGLPPMPFDGALLASRVMSAKEAHTSPAVKQLIVDAPGVDDAQWEATYDKETGGIITVISELGEPIHKIATRGVKLWAELDKKLFSLNKDKRTAWLADIKNAKWVKERLNADFQKPWFPAKLDGTMLDDLSAMTYEEVTRRLFKLVYVHHQTRFIDPSYVRLLGDWIRRVEERFAGISSARGPKMSVLQSYSTLQEDPNSVLDSFFAEYPDAKEFWLSAEDDAFFVQLCQRPGQKPVPFVPVLDGSFQTWFKKDSLWFAEDVDAVFDQDPQRVCILQGPVAVKYSTKVDEPLAEILGEIEEGVISRLLNKFYEGDVSKVPSVDYLGPTPRALDAGLLSRHGITSVFEQSVNGGVGSIRTLKIRNSLPKTQDWLEYLAGDQFSWLRALLCSVSVVQNTNFADNPLARIAAPRAGQTVQIRYDGRGEPEGLTIKGAARSHGPHDPNFTVVDISRAAGSSRINVTLFEERLGEAVPLHLLFDYVPGSPKQIHEVMEGRADRIKSFYWRLWFHEEMPDVSVLANTKEHVGPAKQLEESAIRKFVQSYGQSVQSGGKAPMDIAIVLGWEGIMKALIAATGSADLLRLVHLSNSFKTVEGAKPLQVGDVVSSKASVESIKISETGKTVAVKGWVVRDGKPVTEVVSAFFFRGKFGDYQNCFETQSEEYAVQIKTQADASVLLAKEWFEWIAASPLEAGTTLEFRIENDVRFKDSKSFSSVIVNGAAYIRDYRDELVKVGNVAYESDAVCYGNAVTAWMQRVSGKASGPIPLENGGYTILVAPGQKESVFVAPPSNEPYTLASGDSNPIHVSPVFADFAGLPTTICHGMRQSAVVNAVVASVAAEGHSERCLSWEATFLGMVNPGDRLTISLRHVAMRDGHKIIKAEAKNQNGEKVLEGTATVQQPPSFYCFTGQGSQETGMGMDLYTTSEHAKALWDEADIHLQSSLGLSILEIVRENPKSKTVYFGGVKGHQIRQRYQEFTYESLDESGNSVTLPLFPEITPTSQSFTFFHPVSVRMKKGVG